MFKQTKIVDNVCFLPTCQAKLSCLFIYFFCLHDSTFAFQKYIDYDVYHDLIIERIFIYLDDIIISAETEAGVLQKLQRNITTTHKYGMEINTKRYQFLHLENDFLENHIKNDKQHSPHLKTKAGLNFPKPKSMKMRNVLLV